MPARSVTLPPPVGGWNARDSLDSMQPTDAIDLVNVIPDTDAVRLRNGRRSHSTGHGSAGVYTLVAHVDEDGTRKLLSGANGNIYDGTTLSGTGSSLGSGFTENKWQTTMYKNTTIFVNGTDQPQKYTVAGGLSAANYTGIADDSVLITVNVYKERLYFVEKNSSSIWYGGVAAITGALTEFPVDDVLRKGGYVMSAGSWTQNVGSGPEDFFIIVSSEGEILVYSGSYPGDAAWVLVSRYEIGRPLGRRSITNIASDTTVLTEEGGVPMSILFKTYDALGNYQKSTDKISNAFRQASNAYGSNFGWEATHYPAGRQVVINVPTSNETNAQQFVVNTLTGAWTKYTGHAALTWVVHDKKLYFGGTDGTIYQADYGDDDDGAGIDAKIKWAFNYFDDRAMNKQFLIAKPLLIGDQGVTFNFGLDLDFKTQPLDGVVSVVGQSGAAWDEADWDVSDWVNAGSYIDDWYSISGFGRAAAFKMEGNFKAAPFTLTAMQVTYETGGFL